MGTICALLLTGLLGGSSASADHVSYLRTTPVTDQGNTLQCWAVAATSRFDVAASRAAGKLTKLSSRYTYYTKTRAEVIERLLKRDFKKYEGTICEGCPSETVYYEQGGIYADAVQAAKRFGVVPEEAYPGFPSGDLRLFRELNKLIGHYMEDDTTASRDEIVERVTALLDRHLGKPPRSFVHDGERFTPQSFFEQYLPGWDRANALELNYAPGAPEARETTDAFDGAKYPAVSTGDHDKLLATVERELRAGHAVLLQYKVIDEMRTQRNGHIGFAVHGLTPPKHVDWNSPDILDHYVLAIGTRLSDDGKLEAIYVKNTWGTAASENRGFHWLEADYFPLIEGVEIRE
jgi:bleomycin hydrolase